MRKIAWVTLVLLLAGCAKTMVSENGSFRKSLKEEYYVKKCYQYTSSAQETGLTVAGWVLLGIPGAIGGAVVSDALSPVVCNQDIDEAIRECVNRAYTYSQGYICRQQESAQPLGILVSPCYFKGEAMGALIQISENIPDKEILTFKTYQEIGLNAQKKVSVIRENIPEDEFELERARQIDILTEKMRNQKR